MKKFNVLVMLGLVLLGCAQNQPPTSTAVATATLPENPTATAYLPLVTSTPSANPPSGNRPAWLEAESWVYQLSGYPNEQLAEIAAADFDVAVIDLARDGYEGYFTAAEITTVKESGKYVLAYFEIGAIENYRPEWDAVPADLMLGAVGGWPDEQYVKYWDERWWPIVQGRLDKALAAGFDGAYLDMVVTYEEIPATAAGTNRADLAQKMVALIGRISAYAKAINPDFKVLPQNSPELHEVAGYLTAVDGLGMEELFFLATDIPCDESWCAENRDNAAVIRAAGKLVLAVDYATEAANIASAHQQARAAGFVPYVSIRNLDEIRAQE